MGLSLGIVGLPNAGKSTLFNALVESAAAQVANYPFTTVEPNRGRIPVPDERLGRIAAIAGSARAIGAQLEVVDIAGLVKGASRGEGLGNRFLGHIREVDAVLHVVRCFADADLAPGAGATDPVGDIEIVETELMLADLETVEARHEIQLKRARGGDAEARAELKALETAVAALRAGLPARRGELAPDERLRLAPLHLLTAKPVLYVGNVDEASAATGNAFSARVDARARTDGAEAVVVSAKLEAEIAALPDAADRDEFRRSLGVTDSGLARVARAGFRRLDLITVFTANAKEAHAWTAKRGTRAPDAAGLVHSDFARGFIAAETASFADYMASGGEAGAREAGKLRTEGRDYVVQDGDVILFRFNL